eukprot:363811-Chlamydomonas_euryale.AAC.15
MPWSVPLQRRAYGRNDSPCSRDHAAVHSARKRPRSVTGLQRAAGGDAMGLRWHIPCGGMRAAVCMRRCSPGTSQNAATANASAAAAPSAAAGRRLRSP